MRKSGKLVRMLTAACVGGMMLAGPALAANKPAKPEDLTKMEAALPEKAPATPKKARKVLIYGNANGYVHSSIALGEQTIAKMGEKTGAYTSTISDDPAAFDDLSGYDAVMLVSCTGHFMLPRVDAGKAPDKKATDDEKKAYEAKKKEAEGSIASYKEKEKQRFDNLIAFVKEGKGLAGIHASSDAYYDTEKDHTWAEWGVVIGGYFNGHPYHKVTVKIDDPKSPITAGFGGQEYPIDDETYTFKKDPYSREKLHILTSLDVSKFTEADVKKENRPYDHDYAVSWIHEYGRGRVFYVSHGHGEQVYTQKAMLQEYLAGLQYALGDLEADATPSGAPKTASAK
jgi:type 1 glutamine amidotransferase